MRVQYSGLLTAAVLSAAPASAGLWENIYQGIGYFATPSGSPVNFAGDGFRSNGARTGRLRIVRNGAGHGYRMELDRVFGPDASGRPEILDLGPYELELSGAVSSTMGYTTRYLPAGNADLAFSNLNYELRGKSGAQDVTLRGTLNGGQNLEVNPLGFYSLALTIDNTNSQVELDGVLVDNSSSDTDFNIGPISIKGNIYYDMFVGLLGSVGVDTSGLTDLFPASPMDRVVQQIQSDLDAQIDSLSARVSNGTSGGLYDPGIAADTQRTLDAIANATGPTQATGDGLGAVPEPASLALLGAAAVLFVRRR